MKRILQFLFLLTVCISAYSQATGLSDLKFGRYQIADSQWNVSACMYTATCQIYSKNPGTAYKIPWTSGQIQWAAGDYVAFVKTGNPTNPWNAIQYTANGTQKAVMGTGHIINMGTDYFFFVGNDNNTGQLFSMTQGFNSTAGVTWTGTLNPSVAQVDSYATGGSTTPLAAGQTMQPAQSAPPTAVSSTTTVTGSSSVNTQAGIVTTTTTRTDTLMSDGSHVVTTNTSSSTEPWPTYVTIGGGNVSNQMTFGSATPITPTQQTKLDIWTNKTIEDGNKIYIQQIGGDNNTVTMNQDGNKNLIRLQLQGTNNNITARQGVPGIGQNEMKLSVEGNNNVANLNQARDTQGNAVGTNGQYLSLDVAGWGNYLTIQQTNSGGVGGHYNETTINGNGNSVTEKQTGNGNKIMFVKVDGALNTVDATQKGTGQHRLDATLTGDRNNATVLQEGSTGNNATLNLTNAGGPSNVVVLQNGGQNVGVTTTCATAGGCAPITIRQGY
jgi:hypothetical protein